ncbi:MAG: O-antigen/teichoic acid export membrane protein [Planctomycetota bacterium]|jgi:O-antigen/teichoic acid export membrane protein
MLKNIGSNWTLSVVQILVFMVLTTFTQNTLGRDVYGIWEFIVSTAGPLQLLVLGVPMATVRAVSSHVAKKDYEGATKALGASVSLTLIMGVGALALGLVLYAFFPTLSAHWGLVPERMHDARMALLIVLINLSAGFALRLPYAVFDAHQDFIVRNLLMAGGFVLKLGLTVALLSWRADLAVLAAVQALVAVLEFTLAWGFSRRRHAPVRFHPGRLDWPAAKSILSFSIFAFLLNMGALLAFRLDALVVGMHFDATERMTAYGNGNKIFDPFINILLAIGMVVMPLASSLRAQGREGEVRDIFLKWSKVATNLVLMIGGYLMVVGPAFLAWWLGDIYVPESGFLMQLLMLSFFLFLPVRGVALPVLMGLGKPKGPAIGLLGMGIANVAISLALVGPYGLIGVALGTAIPNVLFALWFARIACKQLEVGFGEWLGYTLGRSVLAALLPIGALLALNSVQLVQGFWPLFLSGLAYVAFFGLLQVLFVYRGDRYMDLYARVMGKLRPGAS